MMRLTVAWKLQKKGILWKVLKSLWKLRAISGGKKESLKEIDLVSKVLLNADGYEIPPLVESPFSKFDNVANERIGVQI